jgi:hypothetical protein
MVLATVEGVVGPEKMPEAPRKKWSLAASQRPTQPHRFIVSLGKLFFGSNLEWLDRELGQLEQKGV